MSWRLDDAKPLPEPMLTYSQLDSNKQTSVKFDQTATRFTSENAFENVEFKMSAILSEPQRVNEPNSCRCSFISRRGKIQFQIISCRQ